MKLCTIGVTRRSAERFFGLLAEHGVERVVDIRLKPGGQLSGFAKQQDLPWFLERLIRADYVHLPVLVSSAEVRDDYRKDHDWARYVPRIEALMAERGIPEALGRSCPPRMDRQPYRAQPQHPVTPSPRHPRLTPPRLPS